MILLMNMQVALGALRTNGLRSVLAMLGVILGVAAVTATLAIGAGAQLRIQQQMQALGSNVLVLLPGALSQGGVRLGVGSRPTLSEGDAWAIKQSVPEVLAAAPTLRGSGQIIHGNLNWATVVLGITPEFFAAREWDVAEGRLFHSTDMAAAAKTAILGRTVADALFHDADPVGAVIRINRVPFTVAGVLDSKGQSFGGTDQDDIVLVPLGAARHRIVGVSQVNPRAVGGVTIKLHADADMATATEAIREVVRYRHRLQPGQADDFHLRNLSEVLASERDSSRVLAALLMAVASVSLLVGGIGIMNVMLVSVTERTREIGLRLAMGARRHHVRTQFLTEAATLSLIGGVIGLAVGAAASHMVGRVAGWPVVIESSSILLAIGFAAAVGIFFGYYPARKASRLQPMEALRTA